MLLKLEPKLGWALSCDLRSLAKAIELRQEGLKARHSAATGSRRRVYQVDDVMRRVFFDVSVKTLPSHYLIKRVSVWKLCVIYMKTLC
jgi:hypothetical protein